MPAPFEGAIVDVSGEGLLAAAGADIVVTSLDQVDVAALGGGRLAGLKG